MDFTTRKTQAATLCSAIQPARSAGDGSLISGVKLLSVINHQLMHANLE
jgi:hypothetical protein